jgi:hypothetical protein
MSKWAYFLVARKKYAFALKSGPYLSACKVDGLVRQFWALNVSRIRKMLISLDIHKQICWVTLDNKFHESM